MANSFKLFTKIMTINTICKCLSPVCEERKGWRGKDGDKSSCFRLGRKGKDGEERKGWRGKEGKDSEERIARKRWRGKEGKDSDKKDSEERKERIWRKGQRGKDGEERNEFLIKS